MQLGFSAEELFLAGWISLETLPAYIHVEYLCLSNTKLGKSIELYANDGGCIACMA